MTPVGWYGLACITVLVVMWFVGTHQINKQIDRDLEGLKCTTRGRHEADPDTYNPRTGNVTCLCGHSWPFYTR